MSNVYFVDKNLEIFDDDSTIHDEYFVVHGWRSIKKVNQLKDEGKSFEEIRKHFCGCCGEYLLPEEIKSQTCSCGHYMPQGEE